MRQSPESESSLSHYNPQRMAEAHEQNLPRCSPVDEILSALVAEDEYNHATIRYRDSDWVWKDTHDRLLRTNPKAQRAFNHCQEIRRRIQELERPSVFGRNDEIAKLRAEYEEAEKPYVRASTFVAKNPRVVQAASRRERSRVEMERTRREFEQARDQALAVINQDLPVDLDWEELNSLLGPNLKRELTNAELELVQAIIDRQEAIKSVNETLQERLEKIRTGQAVAIRVIGLKE